MYEQWIGSMALENTATGSCFGGGMDGVTLPRGSDVVQQPDRIAFNRTFAEQMALDLADRIFPAPGVLTRTVTPASLNALGWEIVRPAMQTNSSEFINYLERCLRAAGYSNASISSGTEEVGRIPYIEIRDGGTNIRIRY